MIWRMFALLWNAVEGELQQLRWVLITVLGATLLGAVPIVALSLSVEVSIWWTLAPWLYSAYRLFAVRRFINMHITGEILESLQAMMGIINNAMTSVAAATTVVVTTPSVVATVTPPTTTTTTTTTTPAVAAASESTGIFDNPFIRKYLTVISNIFLVQTALFLILPLYVNYTMGGKTTAIIIVMLLTIIAIDNLVSFKKLSRFTVKVAVVAYTVGLVFVLFPQAGFYINELVGDKIKIIPPSTAKLVNDIDEFQKNKKIEANDKFLKDVAEYQKRHPKEDMPQAIKDEILRIKREG
ncbi:MAG: hypothetical protein US57_C0008G0031 [Candidatus Moranbacteria bacterium GW2011_GWC2_37_73]|nr:MAG: hypothetical protein UR95_C0001G0081 [Parcubacteria group bacterium GW2011_GWC1_36_108]KKQ00105.1 MAG: hypothetical protein US09_C0021G0025 [Candidatus Moranbacteria bacterium GW2011_GWD1_36_198]KKQ00411.1 MAG: hypothetical protein US10_C0032G0008 [Candidatus Moranbacteria bacterium GW2011_GWD2_36_198]KKQ39847.1 MAG: hypothetical protein US57_C0008G0031 [Candidatus Moranbacteria bacterium GW2011_GWC2_37_73]HBI50552.1 hypothetical protein [Candidatus Moranbacteria bacterium]